MKKLILAVLTIFLFNSAKAGSFSEVFGSEGSSAVSNPQTRSLSYSLQYLAFSGATGFVVKQLFETGFFEPLGIIPDTFKDLSPLAYDKSKQFSKYSNLENTKNEIYSLNDFSTIKKIKFKNSPTFKGINNQKRSLINDFMIKKEKRDYLINKYYD